MPRFADVVESTVETLSLNPRAKVDEESVIQASRLVGCNCFFCAMHALHAFSMLLACVAK